MITAKQHFFELLQPSVWPDVRLDLTTKKEVINSYYKYLIDLETRFNEFKLEFQNNEMTSIHSEKYSGRCISDFKDIQSTLEHYKEEKLPWTTHPNYSNVLFNGAKKHEITEEDLLKHLNDKDYESKKFIADAVDKQLWYINEALYYIKPQQLVNSSLEEPKKEFFIASQNAIKVKGPVLAFNGKKIDLLIMFYTFHLGGLFTANSRNDLEDFLENNFTYTHGDNVKEVSGIKNEISEILNAAKINDRDESKRLRNKQDNVFSEVRKSLNNMLKAIKDIEMDTPFPPKKDSDGFTKR